MRNKFLLGAIMAASVSLIGCAAQNTTALTSTADGDFVEILDMTKINAVDANGYKSARNVKTQWVNLPTKKITRAEYERLKEAAEKNK